MNLRTRGGGVKKSENFVDVLNGSPLTSLSYHTTGKVVACGGRTIWDAWLEDDCHKYYPNKGKWNKIGDLPGGGR